jgi:hypothetical protein
MRGYIGKLETTYVAQVAHRKCVIEIRSNPVAEFLIRTFDRFELHDAATVVGLSASSSEFGPFAKIWLANENGASKMHFSFALTPS